MSQGTAATMMSPRARAEMQAMVDVLEGPRQQEENIDINAAFDAAFAGWNQSAPDAPVEQEQKKTQQKKTVRKRQKKDLPAPAPVAVAPAPAPAPVVPAVPRTVDLQPPNAAVPKKKAGTKRGPKQRPEEDPIEFPDFAPQWSSADISRRHALMGQEERYYGPMMGLAPTPTPSGRTATPSRILQGWQTRQTGLDVENNPDVASIAVPRDLPEETPFPIQLSLNFNNADGSIESDAAFFKDACQTIYSLARRSQGKVGDYTVEYMSVSDRTSLGGRHDRDAKEHKFREKKQKKTGRGLSYENKRNFLIATFQIQKYADKGYVMNENEIRRAMRATKVPPFDFDDILRTLADPAGVEWTRQGKDVDVWRLRPEYRTRQVTFRVQDASVQESNIIMWADFSNEMMKQFPGTERDFKEFAHNLFVQGSFERQGAPLTFVVQYFAKGPLRLTLGFREGSQKDMTLADVERAEPRTYVREVVQWFLDTFFMRRPSVIEEVRDTTVSMRGRLRHPTYVSSLEGSEGSKRRAIIDQLTQVAKYTVSGIMPLVRFDPLAALKKRVNIITDDLESDEVYKILEQYYVEANLEANRTPTGPEIPPDVLAQVAGKVALPDGFVPFRIAEQAQGGRLRAAQDMAERIYQNDGTFRVERVRTPTPPKESPSEPSTASTNVSVEALDRQAERAKFRERIGTVMNDRGKPTAAVAESGYIKSHMDRFTLSVDPKRDPSGLFDASSSMVTTGPTEFKLIQARIKSQPEAPFASLAEKMREALGARAGKTHNVSVKVIASQATFVFYDVASGTNVAQVVVPVEEYPGLFKRPIQVFYWWKTGTMIASASYDHSDQGPWNALVLAWRIVAMLMKRTVANFPPILDATKAAEPPKKTRKRGFERYGTTMDRRGRKKGTTCQPKSRQVSQTDPLDWSQNQCQGQNMIVLPNNEGFPCCFEMPKGGVTAAYKKDVQKKYQEIGMDMPEHVLAALGLTVHPPPLEGVEEKETLKVGFTVKGEIAVGNRQIVRMPIDVIEDVAFENKIPTTRADAKRTPYHKNHIAAFFAWKEISEGRLPTGKTVAFYERVAKYLPAGAGYVEPTNKTPETMHAAIVKTTDILKKALQVALMGAGDVRWIDQNDPIPFEGKVNTVTPTPLRPQPQRRTTTLDLEGMRAVLPPGADQGQRQDLKRQRISDKEVAKRLKQARIEAQQYQALAERAAAEEKAEEQRQAAIRQSRTYQRLLEERQERVLDRAAGEGTSRGGARPDAIEELFDNGTGLLEWIE